jgi:hypothetical protein
MTGHSQANRARRRFGIETRIGTFACAAVVGIAASLPVAAHHSFSAEFDSMRAIKITGAVSTVDWQNPHAWIHVEAQEICERPGRPRGSDAPEEPWSCRAPGAEESADWGFELGSPNGLMRLGWNRNSLKAGDEITVEGSRARDDSHNGNARNITTADGKRLFAGSSEDSTR